MLVTLNEVLPVAKQKKYAVGLFNTVNLEMAKGVIAAAEETGSPVIIGTAEVLLPYASLAELAPMLIAAAKRATVPVVLHFDHGLSEKCIKRAIELGFSSIMYDCSTESFERNIELVGDMVRFAHARNVSVEGELGHVGANSTSAEGTSDDQSMYTEPAEAKRFADETGVDALAVAIGTAHGAYTCTPRLDFERLQTIADTVSVPLVLHGGSGLSVKDFQTSIAHGISKVNIFTDINNAAAKAAADAYKPNMGMTDLMCGITNAVKSETMKKMQIFGCSGHPSLK